MTKITSSSRYLTFLCLCLISGAAIFFSACKQDQMTQSNSGSTLPLNTIPLDGVTLSSIGSSILVADTNGGMDVTGMGSISNGVSADFSSKTSWDETYTINWPETGYDSLILNHCKARPQRVLFALAVRIPAHYGLSRYLQVRRILCILLTSTTAHSSKQLYRVCMQAIIQLKFVGCRHL